MFTKKIMLCVLLLSMLFSAAGCRGETKEEESTQQPTITEEQSSESGETTVPPEETETISESSTEETTSETVIEITEETTEETTQVQTEETTEETTEPATQEEALFGNPDIAYPLDFWFSSGAGAWGTGLTLNADGSFQGNFYDTNMGENTEDYPNGTTYTCNFSGLFADAVKLDEYSYSITLKELTTERERGEEWIEDGMRYIASDPYGLENCTEFILYLPQTPVSLMSEEALFWWPLRYEEERTVLKAYGVYNTTDESCFYAMAEE